MKDSKIRGLLHKVLTEQEQLDELSKKTLGSYVVKAAKKPSVFDPERKDKNRQAGIKRAVDKLTKEDLAKLAADLINEGDEDFLNILKSYLV